MIARVWHGWTELDTADRYETVLREEILPDIASRDISGFRGSEVYRRTVDEEVEFMTILWFESMDGVRAFSGGDVEAAHVPEPARRLLKRYEDRAQHYERRHQTMGMGPRTGST